jgi:S-adenosylmethionine hydrolase
VASEYHSGIPFVAARHDGHFFVATDNGIFGLLFDRAPEAMVRIERFTDREAPNYPAIAVFAPAAAYIVNHQGDMTGLGNTYTDYQRMGKLMATMADSQITGTVIHINAFGNVVTNITRSDFEKTARGRPFEILVQSAHRKITRINRYFHETSRGELVAVFNVSGYLEIAQNRGKVAELLQLTLDSNIIVRFFDKK